MAASHYLKTKNNLKQLNMKYLITLTLLVSISIQSNAQWWGNTVKGNGEVTTEERTLQGDYDELIVAGFFNVTLVKGAEGNLSLEGESNLLQHVITELDGDRLVIKIEKKHNLKTSYGKDIRIKIPFEDLSKISLSGSGEITSNDVIRAKDFSVSVSGSGDINIEVQSQTTDSRVTGSGDLVLKGNTKEHNASVTGSGDLEARKFIADDVDVKVTGSGDIRISCEKSIRARVTGSGDIEYVGNPQKQDTKVSGSGDITRG